MIRQRRAQAPRPLQPDAFVDKVMAAVRLEPTPTPARAFGAALQSRSLGAAGGALAVAWHLATVRAWSVAPSVRARSMALVLAVTLALVSGSLAAAGAVRLASDPLTRLFQAQVDDRGPLSVPPAVVNGPGAADPDDEEGTPPADAEADSVTPDDQGSDDQSEGEANEPDGAAAMPDEHDGADAADEATEDDGVDNADDASASDDDEAEDDESASADDTDAAEPDEPEPDESEADEPDHNDDGESSDGGDTSDDSGSGSDSDD